MSVKILFCALLLRLGLSASDDFTYNGFKGVNLSWDGLAGITSDGLLMLTNATTHAIGHAFFPSPLRFKKSQADNVLSFSTTFVFAIIPEDQTVGSGGFTFVLSPSKALTQASSGYLLGIVNMTNNGNASNHIVAVEFDTWKSPEAEDINSNHVGIDINSIISNNSTSAGFTSDNDGKFQNLTLLSGEPMQVWIEYNGTNMQFDVTLAPLWKPKPKIALLSSTINLSSIILDRMYVGFSGSVGTLYLHHYILGWSFSMDGQAPELNLSSLPPLPRNLTPSEKKRKTLLLWLPLTLLLVVLNITCATLMVVRKKMFSELRDDWELEFESNRFPYEQLYKATRGFKDKYLLGIGGFEIVSLGKLRHRNLVKLLGYCRRKGELLLVYEYMPNGSLDKFLFSEAKQSLAWSLRFRIIKGVASGLQYLHDCWDQVVIHRDIKASNVLLDGDMNGRLGDFGLARLYDHGAVTRTTNVVGSPGFLAPELARTCKVTTSSDVFAFGAFLLEVACGRRAIEPNKQESEQVLVDWVFANWKMGTIYEAKDPRLGKDYVLEELDLVLKLGLLCSHPSPSARPSMRQITRFLNRDVPLPERLPYQCHVSWAVVIIQNAQGTLWISVVIQVVKHLPIVKEAALGFGKIANESQWVTHHKEQISLVGKVMDLRYFYSRFIYCTSDQSVNQMIYKLVRVALLCHLLVPITDSAGDHEFIFNGFSKANLSLDGEANLAASGLLQLTNATQQSKGQAFYPSPLRFKMSNSTSVRSFSTTFVFAIVAQYPGFSAYGFTFCISPTTALHGDSGHYMGLFNSTNNGLSSNHIIGVEFDTIQTPEFNDSDDNHVGIDIHSLISNSSHTAGYYTGDSNTEFHNLSLNSGQKMQVWVEYDSRSLQLNVTLAPFLPSKPKHPLLSLNIDLSSHISEEMYVGFTASEADDLTAHCILGWSFKMDGNANALDLESLPSLPTRSTSKEKSKTLIIWLPVCAFLGLLIAALIIGYVVARRSKFAEVREDWEQEYGPHRFSYKELYQATHGFKDEYFLGFGGFGSVYRGVLPTTKAEVAVKKVSHESRQGIREFVAEVVSLGQLRHRNLVILLGYCRRKGELLLVYEFMPNGSLDKYLFSQTAPCLDWNHRFRIIKGVASSLLYLHEEWVKVVIHRDIKASNVLLDTEFNARLGDFGLARLYDHGTDFQTTHVMGTMGYLAPELARRGKATTRSDVYAFGVFLLEVACGRRPIELIEDGEGEDVFLADWVLDGWRKGDILACSDGRLDKQYVLEEMDLVLKLGLLCCHPMPTSRPSMRQAMQYLNRDSPLPEFTPFSLTADILASYVDEGFDNRELSWLSSEAEATSVSLLSGPR
ncbi:putative protein kinase RLK-Pelle-L-LEC family [Dioscorea sansibarensis]